MGKAIEMMEIRRAGRMRQRPIRLAATRVLGARRGDAMRVGMTCQWAGHIGTRAVGHAQRTTSCYLFRDRPTNATTRRADNKGCKVLHDNASPPIPLAVRWRPRGAYRRAGP